MCMYSLYGRYNTRKAKVGETLTRGEYRGHAAFMGGDGLLACIKHETTLHFESIAFERGTAAWVIDKYEGKPATIVFVEGNRREWGRHHAADCVRFEDGFLLHFGQLKPGITACIPRKVRSDKGTRKPRNLSKLMGLDQLKAEIDMHTSEPMARIEIVAAE